MGEYFEIARDSDNANHSKINVNHRQIFRLGEAVWIKRLFLNYQYYILD